MKKVVALAANYGYLSQIETTLKSIIYQTPSIEVYIVNMDIPQEWFCGINRSLKAIGSAVIDVKVDLNQLTLGKVAHAHINEYSYLKIYLPQLIEAERILYLDSDVIVNHDLWPLLNQNMEEHPIAAARDIAEQNFNTGVLLIDCSAWRASELTQRLVEGILDRGEELKNGDQTLISEVAGAQIKLLPAKYNSQIGFEYLAFISQWPSFESSIANDPVILHYLTDDKPWLLTSSGRARDEWWKYRMMDWSQIIQKWLNCPFKFSRKSVVVFAESDNLYKIEELLKALPMIDFEIISWLPMSFKLLRLLQYPNVKISSKIVRKKLDLIIQKSIAMLDLSNPSNKEFEEWFAETGKPVLGLEHDGYKNEQAKIFETVNDLTMWLKSNY
ncbi:hypothetical protein DN452_09510 [Lactobacillus reuteri]|uniref:glycosyltransferase family 8 protein n=1 Tax=Limosilactobacillus reuteri TaxID=1598 RepID=UPI000BEEFE54|nr:glycosyltransferase family 8 protein [Limosilactobacillus reuteri]MQB80934.1 hypothetical protein [Limosilactobacillus reuteri]MQB87864.1 hypothetical protein [Limosilactobacillus reuteri]PEH08801.1 hypothetical protein CP354_01540 [Lactobacillus sp. UMNPBX3]